MLKDGVKKTDFSGSATRRKKGKGLSEDSEGIRAGKKNLRMEDKTNLVSFLHRMQTPE
jgi:hypothetical protein